MITFNNAAEIVLSNSLKSEGEFIPLSEALGRVLAQPVYADRDMPPFDKSAVDGYACKAADIVGELKLLENIAAGFKPGKTRYCRMLFKNNDRSNASGRCRHYYNGRRV